MSVTYNPKINNEELPKGLQSVLEKRLIREYLRRKGYRIEDLHSLPKEEAKRLMGQACRYASLKLAEIESKTKFRKDIRSPHSS